MPTRVAASTTAATPVRLARFCLVWASAGCGVLNGPPHKRKDPYGDRDIADCRGQAREQCVDVSVHLALGTSCRFDTDRRSPVWNDWESAASPSLLDACPHTVTC